MMMGSYLFVAVQDELQFQQTLFQILDQAQGFGGAGPAAADHDGGGASARVRVRRRLRIRPLQRRWRRHLHGPGFGRLPLRRLAAVLVIFVTRKMTRTNNTNQYLLAVLSRCFTSL